MAKLLSGKAVAEALNDALTTRAAALIERGTVPTLAIVRCGEDPSDLSYEKGALARAERIGVRTRVVALPPNVTKDALIEALRALDANDAVHGILLFRPLPKPLRPFERQICNAIGPEKDVDSMTDHSCAGVFEGREDLGFAPCTPCACMALLDHYGIELKGKRAAVIGRSLVVGKPLAMLLMGRHATVTVCHTRTRDVAEETRRADIVVTAAGALGSLTKAHVRPGQAVIDVSVNWDENKPNARGGVGAIAGDAVFDEVEPIVDAITPVPGGVGAVTTSVLVGHVIEAAERLHARRHEG